MCYLQLLYSSCTHSCVAYSFLLDWKAQVLPAKALADKHLRCAKKEQLGGNPEARETGLLALALCVSYCERMLQQLICSHVFRQTCAATIVLLSCILSSICCDSCVARRAASNNVATIVLRTRVSSNNCRDNLFSHRCLTRFSPPVF